MKFNILKRLVFKYNQREILHPLDLKSDNSFAPILSRKKRAVFNWPAGARFVAEMYLQVPLRTPTGYSE